jgi:type I restriction-modification system DNA methylase subunit
MANVYPGINNFNEYYTNHYFSSIFEENTAATISVWRDAARASENLKTPWSMLRDCGKQYYTAHEKFLRARSSYQIIPLIKQLADSYLSALSYPEAHPFKAELYDGRQFPVYLEIKKQNGMPLLWVVLSLNKNDEDGIMDGFVFDGDILQESDFAVADVDETLSAEDAITKALFSNDVPPRWIVLIGMNGIALVDRNKWNEKRYLGFDVSTIFSYRDEKTLQAMAVLLHKESLCPEEGTSLLDELDENSHRHAAGVSQDLKYALRESIELLGNEVLYDLKHNKHRNLDTDPVDPGDLTMQCLRYMYRMLFVLFIEARPELGYAPMRERAYAQGYSLEQLRDVADEINENTVEIGNGYYFNETISGLFHLIYHGYPENQAEYDEAIKKESIHDTFVVPPLKAHIFDPDLTPLITQAKLRNSVLLKIIRLMSVSRGDSKSGGGRISYANLGINQLGSVYESLLSYRGFIAEKDLYEVKRAGDSFDELDVGYFVSEEELNQYTDDERVRYEYGHHKGKPRMYEKGTFIYRLAGREREKSASYYTPEVLTKCLVKYALKELLVDKTADEILNLTICEPAMGSAAFLNEAINQLADAYVNKKQEELGILIPYEDRFNEVQKVKMFIADRNVFGVDLNSTAVELAEVSLWLNTICEGGHIPWFGTQIVNGNSLIGARKQVYRIEQLETNNPSLRWYTKAPDRIAPGETRRGNKEVYHFLLGDPGMCNYTDKVIKGLAPKQIELMKKWSKEFTDSYNPDDIESLLRLSRAIDTLWREQVNLRNTVKRKTADKLSIFGHDDNIEESHTTIRQKDYIFRKLYKTEEAENAGPYARLKFAMDYWCALWFWPIEKADLLPSRETFIFDMSLILEGGIFAVKKSGYTYYKTKTGENLYGINLLDYDSETDEVVSQTAKEIKATFADLGTVNLDQLCEQYERLALVREIAKNNHFMHWELEFAELFEERGGFDLMIGNPPWIKITWNEEGVLSDCNPIFSVRKLTANQTTFERNNVLISEKNKKMYFEEYTFMSGEQSFINSVCNYPLLEKQQVNLYKCFLPLAWYLSSPSGIASYVHPEGVYDDPNGGVLRKVLYKKLKYHFQFQNETKLFEIGNRNKFSLNVYCNKETDSFDSIANIFYADTIDYCYQSDGSGPVPGIKDKNDNWSRNGHKDRILRISENELTIFAKIFDSSDKWENARLPALHCTSLMKILLAFEKQKVSIASLGNKVLGSVCWDETGGQNSGIIKRNVHFPSDSYDCILSGPHIGQANPIYQASQRNCSTHRAFDNVQLDIANFSYLQRCNYSPLLALNNYLDNAQKLPWGNKTYLDTYRVVSRKMLNLAGERTLVSSIIPPGVGHINGIFGLSFKDPKLVALVGGSFASLPFDFLVKTLGSSNFVFTNASMLPVLEGKFVDEIIARSLVLNCLTSNYSDLWKKTKPVINSLAWSKNDERLQKINFNEEYSFSSSIRNDLSRRQALVELDVLVSLSLGMTLEQLVTAYEMQFPVLQMYENDTWYDQTGRIVFTANRGLSNVGFERPEWESIRNMKSGTYCKTVLDDTMPGGPVERTITYVAPFTKCNRIEDYKNAWEFFTKKYGEVNE